MITGGECLLYKDITQIITEAVNLSLNVSIQTNGRIPLDDIPEEVMISVLFNEYSSPEILFKNISHRKQAAILFQDMEPDKFTAEIKQGWTIRKISSQQPKIDKNTMNNCGLDRFFYKKNRDSCLNGKMFILHDGSVVPCFQAKDFRIGNIVDENFTELYRLLIQQYWYTPLKEQIKGEKRSSCELIYACTSCRFSDVENNCVYNPLED
jgi:radical SAM protein with 4Fe4S-binding SPASM domain